MKNTFTLFDIENLMKSFPDENSIKVPLKRPVKRDCHLDSGIQMAVRIHIFCQSSRLLPKMSCTIFRGSIPILIAS